SVRRRFAELRRCLAAWAGGTMARKLSNGQLHSPGPPPEQSPINHTASTGTSITSSMSAESAEFALSYGDIASGVETARSMPVTQPVPSTERSGRAIRCRLPGRGPSSAFRLVAPAHRLVVRQLRVATCRARRHASWHGGSPATHCPGRRPGRVAFWCQTASARSAEPAKVPKVRYQPTCFVSGTVTSSIVSGRGAFRGHLSGCMPASRTGLFRGKQGAAVVITFAFQIRQRNEAQCRGVDAVAQAASLGRAVREDVAEMAVAVLRTDFRTHHAAGRVTVFVDVFGGDVACKAGPAAVAVEFVV